MSPRRAHNHQKSTPWDSEMRTRLGYNPLFHLGISLTDPCISTFQPFFFITENPLQCLFSRFLAPFSLFLKLFQQSRNNSTFIYVLKIILEIISSELVLVCSDTHWKVGHQDIEANWIMLDSKGGTWGGKDPANVLLSPHADECCFPFFSKPHSQCFQGLRMHKSSRSILIRILLDPLHSRDVTLLLVIGMHPFICGFHKIIIMERKTSITNFGRAKTVI